MDRWDRDTQRLPKEPPTASATSESFRAPEVAHQEERTDHRRLRRFRGLWLPQYLQWTSAVGRISDAEYTAFVIAPAVPDARRSGSARVRASYAQFVERKSPSNGLRSGE